MSSLHSTLTVLIDALVRDLLRAVRESSVHELVGMDVRGAPSSLGALGAAPPSPPRGREPRTGTVAKRGAPKTTPRTVEAVRAEPKKRRARRAASRTSTSPLAASSDVTITEGKETPTDDVQITDPEALLRETAATVPVPRPWASEMAVVSSRVEAPSQPTLREGEALLRTASGCAVLRRRRNT